MVDNRNTVIKGYAILQMTFDRTNHGNKYRKRTVPNLSSIDMESSGNELGMQYGLDKQISPSTDGLAIFIFACHIFIDKRMEINVHLI